MKRYELSIEILNQDYVDQLIVALVRQGNAVYLSYDNKSVCFEVSEEELKDISPVETNTISDGYGNEWDKKCPECGKLSMVIIRPGDARCDNCDE